MSSTTFGQKGIEAVHNKEYAAAVPLLDKALESSDSPAWLLARAQAQQQLKNYDAALHDAELAYHVAADRGSGTSRKLMIDAQYRRATIYFKLGRYADSDCCAKWSMNLAEGRPARENDGVEKNVDKDGNYTLNYEDAVADKKSQPGQSGARGGAAALATSVSTAKTGFENEWNRAYAWRSQALGMLKGLPEDHPGRKVSVTKIPARPVKKKVEPVVDSSDDDEPVSTPAGNPTKADDPAPGSVPDEKLKLRVDFYQTNQTVTVSIFVKDVKKDDLRVEFAENQVQIAPLPREVASYVKPGDREATSTFILGGGIVPSGSRWTATPRKIELVLQKAVAGVKWGKWGEEKIGAVASEDVQTATSSSQPAAQVSAQQAQPSPSTAKAPTPPKPAGAPAYPTSSKSGPKNWDKVVDGEDDEDNKDVNAFFKTLYKGATPEQQRAMMKSFVESNGTALSTDWSDVKGRTVETIPPEGVEAKKWT
ncbi:SGS domain-containing protein [Podospora appendiculata]|uniref:SGS domain-containing protein n=1 Tax=Podospora appendiculata TaxID=314037 RepID=A0AAE0X4P7_9PEZI|nr:SGS domain-containing protein [Podospora appendiculata]